MAKRFFPFQLSRDDTAAAVTSLRPGRMVEVSPNGTPPIDQQLADAFNANNAVMAYVLAMTGSNLPALTPQPTWYQSFVNQFSDAKVHAMAWQNTVTPGLVAIPSGILNFAPLWSLNTGTISQAITILDQDPGNQQAQQAIRNCLQSLKTAVGQQLSTATDFQQTIQAFAGQLTADGQNMQGAIKQAQSQVGYDKQQVANLTNAINALNDEIATWQTVVTASAIGAGVAFFAGAVIAIFTFGAGLAFGIIGAAAGIALLIAAEVKIQQLAAQVAQDQLQMNELNQQIAALTLLGQNLNTLISLSSQAGQQVELLLTAWRALEAEIGQVITDLDNAQGDLTQMNLPQLQSDMNQANADWQALQQFCTVIAGIQYNQATPPTVTLNTAPKPALV